MEYIFFYLYSIIFLSGIIIGSFLNVCIYRIPMHEDIVSKRSHCLKCGGVLRWYELIPLVSFVVQKGKCRNCGIKMSYQYPLVELLNGLWYVWIFAVRGFSLEAILYCLCGSALLVISIIDWRTYEIPIGCNIFIGVLGLIRLIGDYGNWKTYLIGFFVVSCFLYILYMVTKRQGIGGGDIKLMAAAGLLLGWQNIILALVVGCIVGSIIHLSLMKFAKKDHVLAFGPYLSLGIAISMLYGEGLIRFYMDIFL